MRHRSWMLSLPLGVALLAFAACRPETAPSQAGGTAAPTGAERPAEAVRLLTRHLREGDLAAFARDAVPADTHLRLEAAWRTGRTRWPLDELPFGTRLPQILAALSAPGAEAHYRRVFDRQFAGADAEIDSTAATLGLFGAQYVRNEGDFGEDQRDHYPQLIAAAARWAQQAPLADPRRAHAAIDRLCAGARATGLASAADFARHGMDGSLRRLEPFATAGRTVLSGYGLDLGADLGTLDASLQSQTGDTARVRMRYRLGGTPIDTVVDVERHDGRWYVSDFLRGAADALRAAGATAPAGAKSPPTPGNARSPDAEPGARPHRP